MLRIHQRLGAGGYPNAATLARDIEVCTKTIHRDLEFMRDRLGLPLAFVPAHNGYHYTGPVENFPALQISEGELFALLVAEKALAVYRGTAFEARLTSAFRKISAGLPDSISLHLAEWEKTVSFHTSAEPLLNLEIFDRLAKAVAARHQLQLRYRKPGRATPELRVVDPYHLGNINGDWFLFAHDHLRSSLRTFVPARILAAEPTGKTFAPPKKFSLRDRLRDSFGIHSGTDQFAVVLHFNDRVADYIREKRWHPSQRLLERPGGGVELRLQLSSLIEITRWILSWGGDCRVLAPPALAEAVHAAARKLLSPD
jgi:proteasome accessory factor B